jgi:hypothetical protein
VSFSIKIEHLDEEQRKLAQLGVLLHDLRPFWPRLIPLFTSWMSEQFDSEGRFWGSGWVALSADYAAWKHVHFPGKKILSRGGHSGQTLRGAATSPTRIVAPLMLELRINPYENDGRTIEPDWFQSGTSTMPARPLLTDLLPAKARAEIDIVATDYAHDLVRRLRL